MGCGSSSHSVDSTRNIISNGGARAENPATRASSIPATKPLSLEAIQSGIDTELSSIQVVSTVYSRMIQH